MKKKFFLASLILLCASVFFPSCDNSKKNDFFPLYNALLLSSEANLLTQSAANQIVLEGINLGFSTRDYVNIYYWDASLTTIQRAKMAVDDIEMAGGKWWRPHLVWGMVEPNLLYPNLTKEEVTDELVDTYSSQVDWSFYDELIPYAHGKGINLMLVLCAGYQGPNNQLPMFNGNPVTPRSDISIGADSYVANCYLHSRAVVRRYKDSVKWWQCENEINVAGHQTLWPLTESPKWRDGSEWWSGAFCEGVLTAIRDAVKIEDPTGITFLNFHQLNKDAINAWAPLLDVVGFDFYTSIISGDVQSANLYNELVDVQNRAGAGKPILLAETGSSSSAELTDSEQRDFEDWMLRSYYETMHAKIAGGVNLVGYLYFTMCTAEINKDGEYMGLVTDEGYKWGYDVIQELYASPASHATSKFNNFEAQNGFQSGTYASTQIISPGYGENYGVKVVVNRPGWLGGGTPGVNTQCVIVQRPDSGTMDITDCRRVGFFVKDTTGSNSIMITLVDAGNNTCKVWSDWNTERHKKTRKNQWTLMTYPSSGFTGIDKTHIKEIRVAFYWNGTYYVDQFMKIK